MAYIREMVPEDLAAVAELEKACFSVPWSEILLQEALESPLDHIWVLEEEVQVVGYCDFRVIAGEGELMRIAVSPAVQGRGFGRKLMEQMEADARESQAEEITLEVRASNEPAIRLYKACGFQTEAVRKRYYTHPVEDALIMWRRRS